MVGIATIDGEEAGELTPARNDPLVRHVRQRLADLGAPTELIDLIDNHVEMKVAAMMVARRAKGGDVTINNAPCGSRPGEQGGCHTALELFLLSGSKLTVNGTTVDGKPFRQTYVGRAPR